MLIQDNQTLTKYVPNTLKSVAGEQTLFDKISPHLIQSDRWLTQTFVSDETMTHLLATESPTEEETLLLHHLRMATAAEAMLHAVPMLDLVLTPNGFGVVSNQNIAPASKERVERLLSSLEKMRDDALNVVLTLLPSAYHWTASSQFDYFSATMLPWLDTVHDLGYSDHLWQHYQEIHAQLVALEERLARDFFSAELMNTLRTANLLSQWSLLVSPTEYRRLYQRIAAIEFSFLRIGELPMPSVIDAVNIIRTSKANLFSEWKNSDTALLFEPYGFQNKKESSGYFF